MLFQRINNWFSKFQKYLFTYKDGFWELPCLSNSPDALVESLAIMPFNKIDREKQIITTNNPFNKGLFHYLEIESGLWINVIDTEFKANICFKMVYDNTPSTYYSAGYYVQNRSYNSQIPTMNGMKYNNKTFVINKPGVVIDAAYYKGTSALFICIYFDEKWFENNILVNESLISENLKQFLESDSGSIVWPDLMVDRSGIHTILNNYMINKLQTGILNVLDVKIQTLELLSLLFKKIGQLDSYKYNVDLSLVDKKSVLKAEKILIENILTSFPGIENIANEVGISPTKLKANFKLFFGKTLFNYYQEKQMDFAMLKIQTEGLKINEVASILGYVNAGKFSKTFKSFHGILPSEVNK